MGPAKSRSVTSPNNDHDRRRPTVSTQEGLAFVATGSLMAVASQVVLGPVSVIYCALCLAFLYWGLKVVFYVDSWLLKVVAGLVGFVLLTTLLPALVGSVLYIEHLFR